MAKRKYGRAVQGVDTSWRKRFTGDVPVDTVLAEAAKTMGLEEFMNHVAGAITPYIRTDLDCARALVCLLGHSHARDAHRVLTDIADQLGRDLSNVEGEKTVYELISGPDRTN